MGGAAAASALDRIGIERRAGDASGPTAELAARDVYKKSCIFAARRLILAGSWGMRIRHHNNPDRRKRLKLLAAAVGGGALVVMGALSINLLPDRGMTDRELQTIVADPMQTGETVTTTTPPVAPETSVAVPPVTAPPYGGG